MTKNRTIQLYRGTTAQNNAYTGSAGEITMDTTTNTIRIHDGTTQGGHAIGGGTPGESGTFNLFDFKWADHELNDMAWLRADTFSWQSGTTYSNAYDHLTADINGKSLSSETVAGITVQFYLADDGHKICPASEENNVVAIYAVTGIAWYYILDTTNTQFKLPRINPDKERLLPDSLSVTGTIGQSSVTGRAKYVLSDTTSGNIAQNTAPNDGGYNLARTLNQTIDGMSVSVSTQVLQEAGKKYLYFYVGEFTQTAIENTAGLNAELFNGKLDLNLGNATSVTKSTISSWGMPDYESGVSKAASTSYTEITNGYLFIDVKRAATGEGNLALTIGTQQLRIRSNNYSINTVMFPIKSGITYSYTTTNLSETIVTYYPCIGG